LHDAAANGIVGYPLTGIDVEITNAMRGGKSQALQPVRLAKILQGEQEYCAASDEEKIAIIQWWRGTVVRDTT
jgi:hypothetical protein